MKINCKKLLLSVFTVLLILLCACGKGNISQDNSNAPVPNAPDAAESGELSASPELLGSSEAALIEKKGDGKTDTSIVGGEEVISSRSYQEEVSSFQTETVYLLHQGTINGIVHYFVAGTDREEVLKAAIAAFGEPTSTEGDKDDSAYSATWDLPEQEYILQDTGGLLAMSITQK